MPAERLRHARGQSFPDLIALRGGQIPVFPDGVAYPLGAADVRELLRYAAATGARLIPYGGGTSVVGHINPQPGEAPVLTVDMRRMNRLLDLDAPSSLATFGAGVAGPDLEAQLRAHGYTLGHYPQSFEQSTLGGWIATRSRGQQSLGYGRIEQMFVGGSLEAPAGSLRLPPFPASATGPDVREMVLGSEGRLGILTEAIVRVVPIPPCEAFHAVFFPDWERAYIAVRTIAQSGCPLSMVRLSTPTETAMNFALAGHRRSVAVLKQLLALRGVGAHACMLLLGFTGSHAQVDLSRRTALGIAHEHRGVHVGRTLGRQWQRGRFRAPYLRDELWQRGYAVDTVETATNWSGVPAMVAAVERALRGAIADQGERVHAFTHLSHVYPHGSSVYTTYLFRLGKDADETYAPLARAQDRGQPGDRRARRHDQPPARRRQRPPAISCGREGRAGHRRDSAAGRSLSIPTGCSIRASSSDDRRPTNDERRTTTRRWNDERRMTMEWSSEDEADGRTNGATDDRRQGHQDR